MRESHGVTGRLTITVTDGLGRVIDQRQANNLITTAGRGLLVSLLKGEVTLDSSETAIVIGTGTAKPDLADAKLGAQADRVKAILTGPEAEKGGMKLTVKATFPVLKSDEPEAISEAGIQLTPAGSGKSAVLYNRVTFPPINRTQNLDMTLSWEVLF